MATLITKNSSTASAVPAAGDLVKGELAVNVTDKKVYTKDNSAAVVKLVGSLGNQEANAVAITGGAINGTTIGATTPSTGAFTTASASGGFTGNLTGNVTGNVSGTAANVTGVVAIANGGTGLSSLGTGVQSALGQAVTGSGSFVLSTSPSLTTPNLGTPSAAVLTNATGLPLTTGVTGTLGVANGGTGQTTANAAFNALAPSQSTHAGKYLKTDGTNTSWDAIDINTADITGTLPIANGGTGLTALGTGVQTALGQNVTGSGGIVLASSPSLTTPNLGTPSAVTLTNATGLPLSTGVTGTLATTNGGTGLTSFTANRVFYASSTSAIGQSANLTFDGTNLGIGTSSPSAPLQFGKSVYGAVTSEDFYRIKIQDAGGIANDVGIGQPASGAMGFNVVASTGYYQWDLGTNGTAMTLNASGNLGIGTTSPSQKLSVAVGDAAQSTIFQAATGRIRFRPYADATNGAIIDSTNTAENAYSPLTLQGSSLRLFGNNATGAIIDSSGNLGIGIASPAFKLQVNGAGSQFALISTTDTTSTTGLLFGDSASNTVGRIEYVHSDNGMRFFTNGTSQATLDSSGNLGLGVTPSAWASGYKALQIGATGALWQSASGFTFLSDNAYVDSGAANRYITTNFATLYRQQSGQHNWFTAPSGTAGNAISFTQAMTLDANQKLTIGATATNIAVAYLVTQGSGDVDNIRMAEAGVTSVSPGIRAIGDALVLKTNSTERARITSGGYFKASNNGAYTNSTGSYFEFYQTAAVDCLLATRTTDTAGVAVYYSNLGGGVTHTNSNHFYGVNNGTIVYRIAANGNVTNTNNSYGAISDIKLKENITDATPKLASLNQLRVVNYNFKGSDLKQIGLVAQEVEQVFPGLVETSADRDAEGNDLGTTTKSVKYSVLVPMLLKAVQELTAMNDDLRARVAQLEAK